MQTQIIHIEYNIDFSIRSAVDALHNGEIVVFPTDTVYGLGCIYNSEKSVNEIYKLKTRDFKKPLAAYFSGFEMMGKYINNVSDNLIRLCERFLPGPLTIVTEKNDIIKNYVTYDNQTIGIRIPKNEFLLDVIDELDMPIVGTSANISNHQSAKTAKDAYKIFNGLIPFIFEDDYKIIGLESTVISIIGDKVKLLREGVLPFNDILTFLSQ